MTPLLEMSRRRFLALGTAGAGAVALAACGGSSKSGGAASATTSAGGGAPGARLLGAAFSDGYGADPVFVAGIAQRAPFVVFDAETGKPVREGLPDAIDIELRRGSTLVSTFTVERHDDGIPTPYYPLIFTPADAGDYEARVAFSARPQPFRVDTRNTVKLVQVGDPLRPFDTPTTSNARGVKPVCTRSEPCPLHEVSLTDALKTPGPIVFIVATPGFCQTAVCGPVLDLLLSARAANPGLRMIHAEPYLDPEKDISSGKPARTAPIVDAYALTYEPSLYVADRDHIVRARLDFTWDKAEITKALATAGA